MKNIFPVFVLFFIFLVLSSDSFSYDLTRTRLYLSTTRGYKLEKLVFGINPLASNSLDTTLGENEIFPSPPPEGMQAGFMIYDTIQQSNVWTYLDLKPYPKSDTNWVYFELDSWLNSGDVLSIRWNPIGHEIDSIFIIYLSTNGSMMNVDMKSVNSVKAPNTYIKQFIIKVKYPNKEIYVDENKSELVQIKMNNAVSDQLIINSEKAAASVKIINELGMELAFQAGLNNIFTFNCSDYSPGIYFVIINYTNSTSIIKKVLKI